METNDQGTVKAVPPESDNMSEPLESADLAESPDYESLRLMYEDSVAKAASEHEQLLRAHAELDNMRRRGERELEKARKFALEGFFQELLPVRDSLEMGLVAAQEPNADPEKLKEGIELTLQMIDAAMAKFGLKEINPLHEPFNPALHQAMAVQVSSEHAPNTVIAVYQKGFVLNDRLVRPARVVVSKADATDASQAGSGQAGPGGGSMDFQA